jgi:hypothetical protein
LIIAARYQLKFLMHPRRIRTLLESYRRS